MVLEMYSIYDKKSRVYSPPRYGHNWETFSRQLGHDIKQDQGSLIFEHAEDYEVFYVGTWSDSLGTIELCSPPEYKAKVFDLLS